MPNKRKIAKLQHKLLLSGKLDSKKNVKQAKVMMERKIKLDQEDINFDFENDKNDFGKLEEDDDDTRKLKPSNKSNSKRKAKHVFEIKINEEGVKKAKVEKKSNEFVPKKSKKNKYFFIAHPDKLPTVKSKDSANDLNEKFVIDQEKIKLNEVKKLKNNKIHLNIDNTDVKNSKKKPNQHNLWKVEEFLSGSEDEKPVPEPTKKTKKKQEAILDITDIDKNFKLIKKKQRLEDGSIVEMIVPQLIQGENSDVGSENDDEIENNLVTLIEDEDYYHDGEVKEDEVEQEAEKKSKKKESKNSANNLKEKLQSSRFRYLNEMLYTQPSHRSFQYFKNDKEAFISYHQGFKTQAQRWPVNPLDEIIKYVKSKPANLVIADFGCGEARLSESVKNKVHSFDLVALNDRVVECDIRNVPLNAESCDIVIFCLSLMGTNAVDFLREANRVLKNRGILKIAEVVSRIEDKFKFIKNIESLGYKLVNNKETKHSADPSDETAENDYSKEYFYFFDFVKVATSKQNVKKVEIKLMPCFYKRR